jgi:uncharacterized protein with HEPN domain
MNRIDSILDHIEEDCKDIVQFISGLDEQKFMQSKIVMKAVCMSLINIGELVKSLPEDFCTANDSLPWRRIAGMRDLVAHKYKTLDMSAVWNVAKDRIPEILSFVDDYRRIRR